MGILASEQPFLKLHASSLWTDLLWDVTQFQARMPQPPKRYILQFLFEEIAHNSFLLYLSKAHQNWSKFIKGLSKVHQRFPTINKCTNCDIKHYGIFIVMIWSATRMYFHFSFDCFSIIRFMKSIFRPFLTYFDNVRSTLGPILDQKSKSSWDLSEVKQLCSVLM